MSIHAPWHHKATRSIDDYVIWSWLGPTTYAGHHRNDALTFHHNVGICSPIGIDHSSVHDESTHNPNLNPQQRPRSAKHNCCDYSTPLRLSFLRHQCWREGFLSRLHCCGVRSPMCCIWCFYPKPFCRTKCGDFALSCCRSRRTSSCGHFKERQCGHWGRRNS